MSKQSSGLAKKSFLQQRDNGASTEGTRKMSQYVHTIQRTIRNNTDVSDIALKLMDEDQRRTRRDAQRFDKLLDTPSSKLRDALDQEANRDSNTDQFRHNCHYLSERINAIRKAESGDMNPIPEIRNAEDLKKALNPRRKDRIRLIPILSDPASTRQAVKEDVPFEVDSMAGGVMSSLRNNNRKLPIPDASNTEIHHPWGFTITDQDGWKYTIAYARQLRS